MSATIVLTCNGHEDGCEQLFPAEAARSLGAARVRAAVHGWSQFESRGTTWDACPVCAAALAALRTPPPAVIPAQVNTDRLVAILLAEQHAEGPHHGVQLLPEGVDVCRWCEDGQHRWCTRDGCPCPSVEHGSTARVS